MELTRERNRGLPSRILKGFRLHLFSRWSSLIAAAVQQTVADAILRDSGGDITSNTLDPIPSLSASIAF